MKKFKLYFEVIPIKVPHEVGFTYGTQMVKVDVKNLEEDVLYHLAERFKEDLFEKAGVNKMKRMQHKDVVEIVENGTAKLQTSDILHILRNPHGWSREQIKRAQLQACDEIENWKDAYEDLRQWCHENWCHENGIYTATRNV